jgi:anti-anti-sigma factor
MLEALRDERTRALDEGYTGMSLTGDVGGGVSGAPGAEHLAEYERRIDEEFEGTTQVLLCQYDHSQFDAGTLSDVAAAHRVDVSPELATIGRIGSIAAARVHPSDTLRLAGELDFESAPDVADVLDAHFHGQLRLDLADLSYIDVAGMRALRGRKGQGLTISASSESVRRLVGLLAWDTDPTVELAV